MDRPDPPTALTVGPEGRPVLSSEVENEQQVLEKRKAVLQRLRRRFAHLPAGVSLADELIAERRAAP